ncbi:uncharacterized protein LOC110157403 isoform X2 [Boleophthalmus pectinirostris]|uniref:uncharacterized protein LOC110157403 isoform X2 n=1 Tax=Boleophthalmus pectinirostris TaxID=150288 RepID=UPI00243040AE|nr:uncharacterized protein LOC110157403 isoform X2 [Boleophthalmus pectinirostris]
MTKVKVKGKAAGKRGRSGRSAQQHSAKESKKPKLITLRASQSEESDNEEEEPDVPRDDDENSTSAFVPASLCSPKPVVPEVEETMEELDILTHMPDVLGMSKNALCPDASCEQVQNESGTVEPCEHQLDLLVDVIDFLSEHTETSEDEGYNEAAQTLLAFGNLANLSQPTQSQASMSDHTSKIESQCIDVESSLQLEECPLAVSEPSTTEVSPTVQLPSSHTSDIQTFTSSGELCSKQEKLSPLRKGRFSKIKPKPNLGSRTTKLRTQTVGGGIETKQVEFETTITSLPQFSEQLEPTWAVSEPSHAESRPTDDPTIVMPSSCISDKQVSYEKCGILETVMSPKLTTTPESLSLTKEETAIKQNVLCDLRTTEQIVEERAQVYDDITRTSQLRSLECQKDSTQPVSEQSNTKNVTLLSTPNEMPESYISETQVIKPSDELDSPSSKNPAMPRKGRLFKLKPKPNIEFASRATKMSSKSSVTNKEKWQIESGFAATVKLQPPALSISESVTVSCEDSPQASLTFKSQGTENFETSHSQEQTELGSQSKFQTHLGHLQETCGTPSVQCAEKQPNQLKPVKSTTVELGNMHSTHSSEEDKTANARPVQQSQPALESSKLSTPQRRRWIPKVKPNLVLSPRTIKSKEESKEKSHATVKSSTVAATSKQQTLQDSSTVPHEYKSENAEPTSSSAVASNLGISMGTMDTTQQVSSELKTNTTNIKSASISELECATFDSSKSVQQPQDTILNNTGICKNSKAICNIHPETSEISTGHPRPVDGAVEPSSLQHNKAAAAQPSGSNNPQDSSIQSNFQYQNLFPSMFPDHIPSDPDEPFFILSLTEIPVCPVGEAVESAPKSCLPLPVMEAQERNPVEPVVPPAPGIDISLSNIHIPTPEKAALRSDHISVEEYLPSAPSFDISILEEHQEKPSVRRLILPEAGDNRNSNIMNTSPTGSHIAVGGAVDTKTNSRRLTRKAAAKEATKHTDITQHLAQVERSVEKIPRNIESASQKESDGSSVTSKIKRKSAEKSGNKGQNRKNFISNEAKIDNSQQTKSATVKSPEVLSLDSLKDSLSCSTVPGSTQESNQQSSLHGTYELFVSQSDSIESSLLEEEPTNVSQYFISDVFTEVESDDCLVTAKSNNTGTGQTAETTRNKRENRKTVNEPRCPLEGSLEVLEEQLPEVSVTKEETSLVSSVKIPSAFSVIETTLDLSQAGTKKTRGKASSNKKNKAPCESLKSQRKFKEALKSPEAIFIDTLEETESTSSMVQPQEQRRSLRCATEFPLSKNDSDVINLLDEELTSVSQYRVEDAFAGVESGNSSVTGKSNKEKAPAQTSETRGKTSHKRTKTSNGPPCAQHDPLTEGQSSEASVANETEKNVNLNQSQTEKTKGKEQYNRNNKATFKAMGSQPQMQRIAALKSPQTPHTRSAMDQPQLPLPHQSDTKESSDDEPTNVSQYFLSDVFTEVDEDLRS